jgi:hypothetical protein
MMRSCEKAFTIRPTKTTKAEEIVKLILKRKTTNKI